MGAKKVGLISVALSLLAVLAIEGAVRLAVSATILPPIALVGIARFVEIGLLLTIARCVEKHLDSLGISFSTMASGIKTGLVWSAVFGGSAVLVIAAGHLSGYPLISYLDAPLPESTTGILLLFGVGALVSPIAEELFFRGYIYGYLRQWGVTAAVIISTVLFVIAHSDLARIPLPQLVGGILFAVAYESKGNLMVPITIHILGNSAIYALSLAF